MNQTELFQKVRIMTAVTDAILNNDDLIACTDLALIHLGRDNPLIKTQKYEAGSEFTLPPDWSEGFSFIQGIEYADNIFLDDDKYQIISDNGISKIVFLEDLIIDSFKLYYTVPYFIDNNSGNIPIGIQSAFINLVCHYACIILTSKYVQNEIYDSDIVKSDDKFKKYSDQADRFLNNYNVLIFRSLYSDQKSKVRPILRTKQAVSELIKTFH